MNIQIFKILMISELFASSVLTARSLSAFWPYFCAHQVITPEEITNPNVDELSVMTYVSYFPEAKLKNGAPLKPKMTSGGQSGSDYLKSAKQ